MLTTNQNPEQLACDKIDKLLRESGWLIQNKSSINLAAAVGVAGREYQTNVGPANYILFVNKKAVGVIEAVVKELLYEQLQKVNGSTKSELIALVSLVHKVSGIDNTLTPFDKTVDNNFQEWIFKKQARTLKYTEEQLQWLGMIKDYNSQLVSCRPRRFRTRPIQQARRTNACNH
jgi:type I site-specific restriction endonuclease